MYTVASHHPRNCRLLLFFGLKRAILVGVDTVEHPSHEVQELVFGHHAIWSLSVMRGCCLPSLCAVTAVYSLMARAAVDTAPTTNNVAIKTMAL
jgi:hypothetical protein